MSVQGVEQWGSGMTDDILGNGNVAKILFADFLRIFRTLLLPMQRKRFLFSRLRNINFHQEKC